MQLTPKQTEVINRIANDSDGDVLCSFFKDLSKEYSSISSIPKDSTNLAVEVGSRQLLCSILESEVINRFSKKTDKKEILEEFE